MSLLTSGPAEATGPPSVAAVRRALDRAGTAASDLDLVIVATATPEKLLPLGAPFAGLGAYALLGLLLVLAAGGAATRSATTSLATTHPRRLAPAEAAVD
jgi:hypothetical protein